MVSNNTEIFTSDRFIPTLHYLLHHYSFIGLTIGILVSYCLARALAG